MPDLNPLRRVPAPIPTQPHRLALALAGTTVVIAHASNHLHADWFEQGWQARLRYVPHCKGPSSRSKQGQQWKRGWKRADLHERGQMKKAG